MLGQLNAAKDEIDRRTVVEKLVSLCRSWPWRVNQITGVVVYWLFAFALVFTISGTHVTTQSPMLYKLCVLNVAVFVLHMVLSCIWLRVIILEDQWDAAMWKRGVSMETLQKFTRLVRYNGTTNNETAQAKPEEDEAKGSQQQTSTSFSPRLNAAELYHTGTSPDDALFSEPNMRVAGMQHAINSTYAAIPENDVNLKWNQTDCSICKFQTVRVNSFNF